MAKKSQKSGADDVGRVARERKAALARAETLLDDAEKILVRAEKEAGRVLAEARQEAEQLRNSAREAAAALVVDAVERAEEVVQLLSGVVSDLRSAEEELIGRGPGAT